MSKQIQIRRSAAQWRALFAAHDGSGLTAAAFCREHALCPKYFSLRRRQFDWQSESVATPVPAREPGTSRTQQRDIALKVPRVGSAAYDRVRAERARQFVRVAIPPRDVDLALTVAVAGVTMTVSPTVSGARVHALIDALRSS